MALGTRQSPFVPNGAQGTRLGQPQAGKQNSGQGSVWLFAASSDCPGSCSSSTVPAEVGRGREKALLVPKGQQLGWIWAGERGSRGCVLPREMQLW